MSQRLTSRFAMATRPLTHRLETAENTQCIGKKTKCLLCYLNFLCEDEKLEINDDCSLKPRQVVNNASLHVNWLEADVTFCRILKRDSQPS